MATDDGIVGVDEFARLKYENLEADLRCQSGGGYTTISGDRAGYIIARAEGHVADGPAGMREWLDEWGASSSSRSPWASRIRDRAKEISVGRACSDFQQRMHPEAATSRAEAIAMVLSGGSGTVPTTDPTSPDPNTVTVEPTDTELRAVAEEELLPSTAPGTVTTTTSSPSPSPTTTSSPSSSSGGGPNLKVVGALLLGVVGLAAWRAA